jgi:hypothetical protein
MNWGITAKAPAAAGNFKKSRRFIIGLWRMWQRRVEEATTLLDTRLLNHIRLTGHSPEVERLAIDYRAA